jgi:hypothetical protein
MVPLLEDAMVSILSSAMTRMIRPPAPGVKRRLGPGARGRGARSRMPGKGDAR